MTTDQADKCLIGIFFLFGIYIIYQSLQFGLTSPVGPGSGLFPFISGALISGGAAAHLIATLRKSGDEERITLREILPIIFVMAAASVFVALAEDVGVFALMPVLFVLTSLSIRRPLTLRGYVYLLAGAIVFSIGAYFVFNRLFGMMIPVAWFLN